MTKTEHARPFISIFTAFLRIIIIKRNKKKKKRLKPSLLSSAVCPAGGGTAGRAAGMVPWVALAWPGAPRPGGEAGKGLGGLEKAGERKEGGLEKKGAQNLALPLASAAYSNQVFHPWPREPAPKQPGCCSSPAGTCTKPFTPHPLTREIFVNYHGTG